MPTIHVCGEALIDFVPTPVTSDVTGFEPKPGGSPYNVALAASSAGGNASFIGEISSDFFGDVLYKNLGKYGVDCSNVAHSDRPTTLAFVNLDDDSPRYAFFNNGSANLHMYPSIADYEKQAGDVLHVGSVSLIDNPASDRIQEFALLSSKEMMISIDPNVRANMIRDRESWLQTIESIFEIATIVKLSLEDLEFLAPDISVDDFVDNQFNRDTALVVISDGSNGATAYTPQYCHHQIPPAVNIIDTVGAGDVLMGSMLAWLTEHDNPDSRSIAEISNEALGELLCYSVTAAALNCTTSGCNPPTKTEIIDNLKKLH